MMQIGYFSIISMISHIVFIAITWRAMQGINFEPLVRKNYVVEARILLIFIAIAIGATVSNFVLDILQWSQNLLYLF
ncbi:MAG TPA: DUF1146 family protein [Candidatus Pseudogracilibacillus intestinigallinarum]|uniref:DUF1146 family protein n=1 Tax=Candidatus Pseudogracilibacillus intestinigallinarum TaxID=2838742 RepID=A0A9D1TJM3_9BACI|nr:DUF1146 family protein [Candidatus Pseudogracilibacillus intestinigallinarum]